MTQKPSRLNDNGGVSQEADLRNAPIGSVQKNGSSSLQENCNSNVSTEESLRAWKSTLDTACKTPAAKSEVGVTQERIIPISLVKDQAPTQANEEVMQNK